MGIGRGFTLIGASAGCVGAVAALMGLGAQQGSRKDAPPEFRAVDQGVGDRTGLSASYRDMGVDLRAPMNFDKVYRVDARSRLLQGMKGFEGGAYARAHGGLVAVFPAGSYREVAPGVDMVQVPAGTVYKLAESSRMSRVGEERERSTRDLSLHSEPLVRRIDIARVSNVPVDVPTGAAGESGASIWTDEAFRQRRVVQLLEWAERVRGDADAR
ncbi:MAG TPA: hypothetical protein VHN77_15700 [Phycisphaerales bacterium]|nr:hypothetical protein [Phycisphaerales bacterium]